MGTVTRLLRAAFRLLLVAWSFLLPMPAYPVRYYAVDTIQEYVLPKGPEGSHGPAIAYWGHTVQAAESRLINPERGLYRAQCEEADILASDCLDLWLVQQPGLWARLAELGAEGRPAAGLVSLSAPFPLAGRQLVIFKELSGTFDPARFDARDWFEGWPPPL